jgi:endonuclease/exonuclease/phosphatase (EEP) superfamily protein YafD
MGVSRGEFQQRRKSVANSLSNSELADNPPDFIGRQDRQSIICREFLRRPHSLISMKRRFGSSLVLVAAVFVSAFYAETTPSSSSAPATVASRTITVAFWNIQWFPGRRPNASHAEENRQTNAVHSDMMQLNADIIGMEEVRDFARAGVAVAPLAGFKVDVCANFPPREGQNEAQQVAIASRLQPLSAWAEEWKPNGAMVPPRGFAFAAYQVAPRQLLLVYGVHLKSNRGDIRENVPMRQESIRQLRAHMAAMEAAYGKLGTITWIVGGDYNSSLDDNRFAAETTLRTLMSNGFNWAWQNVPLAARTTVPPDRDFPAAWFDHIFYRGATLRKAWVANTNSQSSDHRAVVATLDLPTTR